MTGSHHLQASCLPPLSVAAAAALGSWRLVAVEWPAAAEPQTSAGCSPASV